MKKLILVLLTISFTFFMFNSCSDNSNPTITDIEKGQQLQKPKKPPKNVTEIEYFDIGGNRLIDANVEPGTDASFHPVIDISGDLNISYKITSTTVINIVRVELRYDVNANSKYDFHRIERDARIFRDTYFDMNLKTVENSNLWDGTVDDSLRIVDQLASYNYPGSKAPPLDHYIVYISAFSGATTLANGKGYVWIAGAADRSDKRLIVDEIQEFDFAVNKNKVTPIVTLKIAQILNGNPTPVANVYVDGIWEGLVLGSTENVFNPVYSDPNGIIRLEGDSFRKNKSGTITFTVTNVNHISDKDNGGPYYVYDPINNTNWIWPEAPFRYESYP